MKKERRVKEGKQKEQGKRQGREGIRKELREKEVTRTARMIEEAQ